MKKFQIVFDNGCLVEVFANPNEITYSGLHGIYVLGKMFNTFNGVNPTHSIINWSKVSAIMEIPYGENED